MYPRSRTAAPNEESVGGLDWSKKRTEVMGGEGPQRRHLFVVLNCGTAVPQFNQRENQQELQTWCEKTYPVEG